MKNFELMKGDCLESIKRIPSNSIDAIITDPPYGTTASKWDSVIDFAELQPELYRVLKQRGSILLFASGSFTPRAMMSDIDNYKYKYVWIKNNKGNFVHAKNRPMTQHEDVLVFSKASMGHENQLGDRRMYYAPQGLTEVNQEVKAGANRHGTMSGKRPSHRDSFVKTHTGYASDVLIFDKDGKDHPTQKPVALMEHLVTHYCPPDGCVLDFTMGSGSTGVACANTGRNFIGIELDEKYFEIAERRINEQSQTIFSLF